MAKGKTVESAAIVEVEKKPDTVTISLADAEQLYELFKNVELADLHFHSCQSASFRQHVQSVYKAPNIKGAFEALKQKIDEAKEV